MTVPSLSGRREQPPMERPPGASSRDSRSRRPSGTAGPAPPSQTHPTTPRVGPIHRRQPGNSRLRSHHIAPFYLPMARVVRRVTPTTLFRGLGPVRGATTGTRGALRPARRSLADRDAALPARPGPSCQRTRGNRCPQRTESAGFSGQPGPRQSSFSRRRPIARQRTPPRGGSPRPAAAVRHRARRGRIRCGASPSTPSRPCGPTNAMNPSAAVSRLSASRGGPNGYYMPTAPAIRIQSRPARRSGHDVSPARPRPSCS